MPVLSTIKSPDKEDEVRVSMVLSESELQAFMKFASKANYGTFSELSRNKDEAYAMRDAIYAVQREIKN